MTGRSDLDRRSWLAGAGAALLSTGRPAAAAGPALTVAFTLPDAVTNGVAVTPESRIFAALARIDGSAGPRVVEIRDGKPVPFWMPAAQINRLALFQGGTSRVRYPVEVFTLQVAAEPPPNDHR